MPLIYFYSHLILYKKGTFHYKKGHFWSFEKQGTFCPLGGGGVRAPCVSQVPTPLPVQ